MTYEFKRMDGQGDYICHTKIKAEKFTSGMNIKISMKEVVNDSSCKEVREFHNHVSMTMMNDEAIKLRDSLIEMYPIKEQKQ